MTDRNRPSPETNLSAEDLALLGELLRKQEGGARPGDTIPRRSGNDPVPLSFAQQRLWFLDTLGTGHAYTIAQAGAYRLRGRLDVDALEKSLAEIVRRHESLRTRFLLVDGEPMQIVDEELEVPLAVVDGGGPGTADRDSQVRRKAFELTARPFDLGAGPLIRTTLLRLDDEDHALLINLHHIVGDGWSVGVLSRELGALYTAFTRGEPSPLWEPPIQYPDFALWQRRSFEGAALDSQLDYWRDRLGGASALELPADRGRPDVPSFGATQHPMAVSASCTRALKELSRQEGATLFMTLLAGFLAVLHRYTGRDDIAIGAPIANRSRTELEGLIGSFVNILVLRCGLSLDPTFRELTGRVREVCLGAYAHQDVPFERVVQELQPERDLSRNPLVQILFALQNAPMPPLEMEGLAVEPFRQNSPSVRFDLEWHLWERADALEGSLLLSTDLFEPASGERMANHFRTLLEGAAAEPDRPISRLPLLTAHERQQIVVEWNRTTTDYPRNSCVHELFEDQAKRTPEAVALVEGGRRLSYAELNRRANRLAHLLIEIGVGPDVPVGLAMDRSLDMVVATLAILKAGGAYVPLDPLTPPQRLALVLRDSRAPVLLTHGKSPSALSGLHLKVVDLACGPDLTAGDEVANPRGGATARNLAYVMYTSGSTGQPKGVCVEHRGVVRLVRGTDFVDMGPDEVFLHLVPPWFDVATFEIWGALANGGRLVVYPDRVPSLRELGETLERQGVTTLWLTAPLFHRVVEEGPEVLRPVRQLVAGGDVLSPAHVRRAAEMLPGCRLVNGYGPTEGTTFTCCHRIERLDPESTSVPIGRPIANTTVFILDAHGNPVPIGIPGELHTGGDGVARGYLGKPELSAAAFVPDPFSGAPGARLYRTGDMARYRADGTLEFLGRRDQQVKVRGFRIEPAEVEDALRAHPEVLDATVVARPAESGEKRLVAYVTVGGSGRAGDAGREGSSSAGLRPASSPEEMGSRLRVFASERLPDYMVPSVIMILDELPTTSSGKVDRRALPEPELTREGSGPAFVAPRNPQEEALALIWSTVLGLDRVGVHDNFFDLGGDSILGIQILARAQQAGLRLTARHLFQYQTVAGLASVAQSPGSSEVETAPTPGPVPLTPVQRWFLDQDPAEPDHFNQAVILEVAQDLELERLERAFTELVARHDALRLRVRSSADGPPTLCLEEDGAAAVGLIDLSGKPAADRRHALEEVCGAVQAGLSLEEGPLLRAALVRLGPEQGARLLIVIHHMAVDIVSWGVLLEELGLICERQSAEERTELPPRTTPFTTWARRLDEEVRGGSLAAELDYWLSLPWARVRPLPEDAPSTVEEIVVERSAEVSAEVDEEVTGALLTDLPRTLRARMNDALLTALVSALSRWSSWSTQLVAVEGHGREPLIDDLDIGRTVGWFTSLYPVILEAGEIEKAADRLTEVARRLSRVPRGGVGFGALRYLGGGRMGASLASLPQPQVVFNYLGRVDDLWSVPGLGRRAAESPGPVRGPHMRRPFLLEVSAAVSRGRLTTRWIYDREIHRRETVEGLARYFVESLEELAGLTSTAVEPGYTHPDFPGLSLSPGDLARIAGQVDDGSGD